MCENILKSYNSNFLKNCFEGPNKTWYPLRVVRDALVSSFWQIAFVRWKLLPFVQISSRVIIILCDKSLDPRELTWLTIACNTIVYSLKLYKTTSHIFAEDIKHKPLLDIILT